MTASKQLPFSALPGEVNPQTTLHSDFRKGSEPSRSPVPVHPLALNLSLSFVFSFLECWGIPLLHCISSRAPLPLLWPTCFPKSKDRKVALSTS
jgi:hypothetical protein